MREHGDDIKRYKQILHDCGYYDDLSYLSSEEWWGLVESVVNPHKKKTDNMSPKKKGETHKFV